MRKTFLRISGQNSLRTLAPARNQLARLSIGDGGSWSCCRASPCGPSFLAGPRRLGRSAWWCRYAGRLSEAHHPSTSSHLCLCLFAQLQLQLPSSLCAYLSWIALAGLLLNAVAHLPWADPLAALGLLPIVVKEAKEAFEGRACSSDC